MQDVYKIGVEIALQGNLGAVIEEVAAGFEKIDKAVQSATKSAMQFGDVAQGLTREGVAAANAWSRATTAMERAAQAAARIPRGAGPMPSMDGVSSVLGSARPSAVPGSGALTLYQAPGLPVPYSSRSTDFSLSGQAYFPYGTGIPGRPPRQASGLPALYSGGASGGDEPPGGGFSMHGDPYNRPGGAVGPYAGENRRQIPLYGGPYMDQLSPLEQRFMDSSNHGSHGSGFADGMGAWIGGEFLKSTIEKGADVSQLQAGLRGENFTSDQVKAAYDLAFKTMKTVPGSDVAGNLKLVADINASVQNPAESLSILPLLAKYKTAFDALGLGGEGQMQALIKAADEMGRVGTVNASGKWGLDLPKLDHFFKTALAAARQTHGNIGPTSLLQWERNLNWTGQNLPDDAVFENLALIQGLGASRAGRGLFAVEQQWAAGQMSQVAAQMAIDFGLVQGGGTVKTNPHVKLKGFGTYQISSDGWADGVSEQLRTHPQDFLLQTLMPKLDKWIEAHIKGFDKMSPAQRSYEEIRLGSAISSRDPARAYLGELVALKGQVDRDIEVGKAMMAQGDLVKALTDGNAMNNIRALTAAINGFQIALASPSMQTAVTGITNVTGAMNGMSQWADQHAEVTKTGMMALEGAVVALGLGAGAAALAALGGTGGLLAAVGIGSAIAVRELQRAHEWLQHTWPSVFNDKGLNDIRSHGVQMPWWSPLPAAGPGGREPAPGWLEWLLHGRNATAQPAQAHAPIGISQGQPMPVHVTGGQLDARMTNPGDLVHGVAGGIANQSNRPPTGTMGHDLRIDLGSAYSGATSH